MGSLTHGGFSIRTARYRYTEWVKHKDRKSWGNIIGRELYDHFIDPGENRNRAGDAEYQEAAAELSQILHSGWIGALPET